MQFKKFYAKYSIVSQIKRQEKFIKKWFSHNEN